jgi:hypothetical protein
MGSRVGWRAFAEWALGVALLSFAVLGAASIGVFILPFALLSLLIVARRNREWPEAMGGLTGIGGVCLFVAVGKWDYTPCPTGIVLYSALERYHGRFSCGGSGPMPWLAIGLLLTVTGIVMYWIARRRSLVAATTS